MYASQTVGKRPTLINRLNMPSGLLPLGLINSRRYAVIGRFYYEGMSYGLLDRKTGLFSAICGYPLFSADGRWLACADMTTEDAALQILALDGIGSPTIVFDALPTHWGVDDVSWASPTWRSR